MQDGVGPCGAVSSQLGRDWDAKKAPSARSGEGLSLVFSFRPSRLERVRAVAALLAVHLVPRAAPHGAVAAHDGAHGAAALGALARGHESIATTSAAMANVVTTMSPSATTHIQS